MSQLVVIADRSPAVRELIGSIFRHQRVEVVSVSDRHELLTIGLRRQVRLAVLDIFPPISGLKVLRAWRNAGVPTVVAVTAPVIRRSDVQAAKELGVSDIIRKPFDLDIVGERISSLLPQASTLGEPEFNGLIAMLSHPSPNQRYEALDRFLELGEVRAAADIVTRLDDSEPRIRLRAAETLVSLNNPTAVLVPLLSALRSAHERNGNRMVDALMAFGSAGLLDLTLTAIESPDPILRIVGKGIIERLISMGWGDHLVASGAAEQLAVLDSEGQRRPVDHRDVTVLPNSTDRIAYVP